MHHLVRQMLRFNDAATHTPNIRISFQQASERVSGFLIDAFWAFQHGVRWDCTTVDRRVFCMRSGHDVIMGIIGEGRFVWDNQFE